MNAVTKKGFVFEPLLMFVRWCDSMAHAESLRGSKLGQSNEQRQRRPYNSCSYTISQNRRGADRRVPGRQLAVARRFSRDSVNVIPGRTSAYCRGGTAGSKVIQVPLKGEEMANRGRP